MRRSSAAQYPLVSEWGDVNWGLNNDIFNPSASYAQRGWTWSDLDNTWLWTKFPGTVAFLLHFDGRYYASQY